MKIRRPGGTLIIDAPVTKSAVIKNILMGDNYIELPFTLREQAIFPRGSYINYNGGIYKIKEIVNPDYDAKTGGYKYTLRFWSRQNDMKDAVVFWNGSPVRETSFHDTTTLDSFGNLIAASMNSFDGSNSWKVAAVPVDLAKTTKLVSFNGDNCWNGINIIAETFDVEWWTVENGGEIWIHFGKLEFGTEETFRKGEAVKSIPARKGNDSEYGTRFYVFGSTRNIPEGYYEEDTGAPTNHISEKRLHLPDGMSFIDAWSPLAADDIIEQVAFFEDIYPKNTETVTSYETIKRKLEGTDDPSATFDAYVMHCEDTPFLPSDVFEGETLRCLFTSGSLNGREFDLALIKDDEAHTVIKPEEWKPEDGFNRKFEIIADQEDSGSEIPLIIPNASLHPDPGDTFILTGVRLPDEKIKEAEQELLKAGKEWAIKNSSDTNVYDCQTNPVYCFNNDKNYDLGQKVRLVGSQFGETGRSSRIQGYEKKLYNIYDATYTVGDNTAYSRLGNIEKNITEAAYAERIGVTNGVGIYVIRSKYDTTQATDYNVYSALAANSRFLNKNTGGKVSGPVSFGGNLFSDNYIQGILEGRGFGIIKDADGSYTLDIDKINVRQEATINELVINQISFTSGETVFSAGGCEVTSVEDMADVYRCYYDNKDGRRYSGIMAGDQVRCQRYDETGQSIVKYYWRLVTSIGDDYIDISKSDCDGTGIPEKGDNLVQFGNRSVKERQSAIIINPLEAGSIIILAHLNSYNLEDKQYIGLGVNKTTGESYMFCYGDMFFGDRNLIDDFITFQRKASDTERRLYIHANMTIGADSSGLENLSEWKDKQAQIDNAQQTADDAQSRINELQEQVDGVVESFNGFGEPTLSNFPANEWTTDAERKRHNRDIYTDITPYVDDVTTPTAGQSWKWYYNSDTDYGWTKIADSEAVRALQLAQMSVLDADVLFIQTSSQTAKPQLPTVNSAGVITNMNGWSTNAPAWKDGMYIWQSTYTRKGDGSASFSDPTCVSGKDGASVTITSQTVTYQASASGTTAPTGTWSAAIPPVPQGQYLWTRTTVNYSDGKSTTSYAVARQGANGTPYANNLIRNSHFTIGTDGLSYWAAGTGTLKLQTDSIYGKCGVWAPETNDRIFNVTQNVWVAGKTYTYSFRAKASVAGIKLKPSRSIADFGAAHSLTTSWVVYVGQIKATATSNGGTLSFSNEGLGTIYITDVKLEEGVNSNPQWSPYPNEMLGVTITSEEIRYAKGNYPSQPADSAFTLTSIGTLTKGQYLWTRTVVNYSDGKQTKSYTVAYIGTDGAAGNPGQPGSDGKTTYVHFAYASGITGSLPHPTAVTGFKTTAFAGAKYIGVCTDYNQADPTAHTPYEWSEYKGEDGVGIAGIVEQYYLSSSRTALQGGSWSDTRPAWKAGWYYWTRSKTTYTDDTVEYTAGICVTGDAGTSVLAQYSANGSSWHSTFQSGDIYMRTSSDNGSTWSPKMPLVGSNYTPNLLTNSDFNSRGHWSFGTNVVIDPTHKHEGRNSVKSAQSGLTANNFRGMSYYYSENVKEGDVFTASIWVYAEDISTIDSSVNLEIWGYKDSSRVGTMAAVSIKPTKANEWQHFHVSHKMPATANRANLYAYVTKNGTVWFASPKLERGNNPSPVWSPAESEMKGTSYMPNLLLNSKEVDVTVATNNYRYKAVSFESQPEFNVGDTFALSVENITVNQGTPDGFSALLYQHDDNYPGGGFEIATIRHMTANDKTALFTVTKKPTKEVHLLLYAGKSGATAGNAVTYENVMLVRGNNPAPWSPAASEMVGKDGQWRKFQWAKNTSTTTAPTSGWQDTPMTAASGEYVWIRSGIVVPPATAPSSWDTATRLTGDRGAAGESVYMLDLSNEVSGIACDAAGNVTGSYPTSQASVWKGQSKVTSGITWSIAGKTGIDTANISTSGAVSMSGMTADQATITVQAVVTGVTLQSTISLYKVKPGSNYSENLVVKSDTEIQTSGYLMKRFSVTEDLVLGDLYTMTIWGELASGKVFNVYDNKGIQVVAQPQKKAEGLYTATFKWKRSANATDSSFEIYNFPSNVSGTSTIRKIKLEKGKNTSPVWSPAPNEMVGEPAVVYSILPSVDSISRKSDGTASVGSITCEKYLTTGNSARALSTANYLYARQYNENAVGMWELIADNTKTSGTIAVSPALTAVVFELRSSSAASGYTVLDRERVPVLADGADLLEQIDDIKYLESIFPRSTSVNNGATIAKILGVIKDGSTSVIAGLNGTDAGKDATHGKLIFFGGASSITDIANAATRIYEDGTIDTSKLIARNGGQIGSFKIMGDEKFSGLMGKDEEGSIMMLGSSLAFQGTGQKCIKEAIIDVKGSFIEDGNCVMVLKSTFLKPSSLRPPYSNTCLRLYATGENAYNGTGGGNFAIECVYGNFAGLRPNTRRIVSSTTLTLLDHTILIDIQRSITITLPTETDDAGKELIEDGQEYILMVSGGKNTGFSHTLKSPKNRIHWPESDLWNMNLLNFPAKGLIYLIYCYKRWWGYRISNY